MTPAQRKYDQDLIVSLRRMSEALFSRSRKVGGALKLAADRLDAHLSTAPVVQPPPIDQHEEIKQPASRPVRRKAKPARG